MSRPRWSMLLQRRGPSGRYSIRVQVPERLRELVGKRELTRALGTSDLGEAKRRAPAALAWAQSELDRARKALEGHREAVDAVPLSVAQEAHDASLSVPERRLRWFLGQGLPVTPADIDGVDDIIDHEPLVTPDVSPRPAAQPEMAARETAGVTLGQLLEAWTTERRPPTRTRYEWEAKVRDLIDHLGHQDAERVTKADLVQWKDKLLGRLSPKSVKNHIDVVRALYNHAIANERLQGSGSGHPPVNPAVGVKVANRDTPGQRRRPYTREEAGRLLECARSATTPSLRWLPVLLVYTGARLDELCQLTTNDIREDPEAGWFIDIHARDPGRHLKTAGSARRVPLHAAILAEGFLDYLRGLPAGPVFPDLKPDRFGSRGGTATKRLSRWVRKEVGIEDSRVAPAHSARHLFKDLCRDAGLAKDVHDALTGHVAGDVGSRYGWGHSLATLRAAVERLPRLA